MRPIIKTLLLTSAITLGSGWLPALAQGPDPAKQMEYLTDALLLTPEQATQVSGILKETQEKRDALIEAQKPQREAFRKSMSSLHDETREKMSKILNPQQQAKFDKMHEARKARHEKHREGGMMGEGMHHGPGKDKMGDCQGMPAMQGMDPMDHMDQDTE